MQRSESITNLVTALAKAQAEMKNPSYDSSNPHFKAKYASLAAVRDAVTPPLAANGLSLTQPITVDGDTVVCETTLWHATGEFLTNVLRFPLAQQNVQGLGAVTTYLRRYSLMALLNVAGDEDDDGNSASERTTGQRDTGRQNETQRERQLWIDKLQAFLVENGKTEQEIETFWRYVSHKYGDAMTAAIGQKLLGELQSRAKARQKTPGPEPMWREPLRKHHGLLQRLEKEAAAENDTDTLETLHKLIVAVEDALKSDSTITDSEGYALLESVNVWHDKAQEKEPTHA